MGHNMNLNERISLLHNRSQGLTRQSSEIASATCRVQNMVTWCQLSYQCQVPHRQILHADSCIPINIHKCVCSLSVYHFSQDVGELLASLVSPEQRWTSTKFLT